MFMDNLNRFLYNTFCSYNIYAIDQKELRKKFKEAI